MTGVSTIKETSPKTPGRARKFWLGQFPRWFVGLVLIATGTGKALDIPGFVHVLATYALMPPWGNVLVAYTLPFIELATGLCLITRIRFHLAAWAAVVLHVVLLGTVLVTLWRGLAIANCGCFGVFFARPLTGQTVVEDAVMLALSLLVLRGARHHGQQTVGGPSQSV